MFRPHGYFRGISCPNLSDCTLPNCFFSHDLPSRPAISNNAAPLTTKVHGLATTAEPSHNVDEQPTKRRKLDVQQASTEAVGGEVRGHKRDSAATAQASNDGSSDWTVVGRDTKRSKTRKEDGGPIIATTNTTTTVKTTKTSTPANPPLKSILKKAKPTPSPSSSDTETVVAVNGTNKATSKATTGSSLKSLKAEIPKPTLPLQAKKKKPLPLSAGGNKFAALAAADDNDGGSSNTTAANANAPPVKKESLMPRMVPNPPATHVMRQTLLNYVYEELTRLNPELANTEAGKQYIIKASVDEEEQTARENLKTYGMVMRNRYMALKKTTVEKYQADESQSLTKKAATATAAAAATVAGSKGSTKSGGKEGKMEADEDEIRMIETGLTPEAEIVALRGYAHTKEELTQYNYVMVAPSEEEVEEARAALRSAAGYEECDRCRSRFRVYPGRREEDGSLASGGECTYHWGKAFAQRRTPGSTADPGKVWECCNQALGETAGCSTAENHVFIVKARNRLATVWQFVKTPGPENNATHNGDGDGSDVGNEDTALPGKKSGVEEGEGGKVGAICLDCEMCYTTNGLELCRVTATSFPGHEHVLDVLVRPFGEILDLNTRFSGVTASQYTNAKPFTAPSTSSTKSIATTEGKATSTKDGKPKSDLEIISSPSEARDVLLSLISSSTVIVGHALDNDLNALRLIHPTIVDTTILYPHRRGLPLRNSLKWLVRAHLKRHIQTHGVDGHDSREDADSAGDLVRWRMVQDVKVKNINSSGEWKKNKKRK